ncbi:hypothetical protein FJY94_02015 [Candidatus Kaiserbacteria bacterium]|nr:hypothetical protein [Candidatus Kaiserbacteria bacterium]
MGSSYARKPENDVPEATPQERISALFAVAAAHKGSTVRLALTALISKVKQRLAIGNRRCTDQALKRDIANMSNVQRTKLGMLPKKQLA